MRTFWSSLACLSLVLPIWAQNCQQMAVGGLVPLDELGVDLYMGQTGGLYGNGSNQIPAAHQNLGMTRSALVVPRDPTGAPDPTGRIVLLSIGMSNTSQEFSTFVAAANADPLQNPALTIVNGAQGGQTAAIISNPQAMFWTVIDQRLQQAGVTREQVQAVWIKEANANPSGSFSTHVPVLQAQLRTICQIVRARYQNCQLAFLSSRSYGGYATGTLNPEPFAYESAFAVRGVIESQMNGDPGLNADATTGAIMAPWLAWGPYLWANGVLPRTADGLAWNCSDFEPDGVHPGPSGEAKVTQRLLDHFKNQPTTLAWFGGTPQGQTLARAEAYGTGCPGTNNLTPNIITNGPPRLGSADFRIGFQQALPNSTAALIISLQARVTPIAPGCSAWIDLDPTKVVLPSLGFSLVRPTLQGAGFASFFIPNDPILMNIGLYATWVVADPNGSIPGGASATRAMHLRLGV